MAEFIPTSSGGVRLLLDDAETELLRRVAGELRALMAAPDNESDPVIERLFPSAYESPADEAVYRDLIGDDLMRMKLASLDAVSTSLGPDDSDVTLEGDPLHLWLACLTDMRLAIGTRLEVDEDQMGAEIDPADPDHRALAVLHWLGWIQEGLIRTTDGL